MRGSGLAVGGSHELSGVGGRWSFVKRVKQRDGTGIP